MRHSPILDAAARALFHPVLLIAVYLTFRGHNAPGGGFAGGLVAGAAFLLRWLADGRTTEGLRLASAPERLIAAGLAVALATGIAPLFAGEPLLTSSIWKLDVALIGEVKLVSSTFFDLGVFAVVLGAVLSVGTSLGGSPDDEFPSDRGARR
jgi:multicomponent Na+:H+ antiporter subunit A